MSIGSMMFRRFFLSAVGPYIGPFRLTNAGDYIRLNAGTLERSSSPPTVDFTILSPNAIEAFFTSDVYIFAKYAASYEYIQDGIWTQTVTTAANYNTRKIEAGVTIL